MTWMKGAENRSGAQGLSHALEHSRFELVPTEGAEEQAAHLPIGAKVTVGVLSRGVENSLELAERLTKWGLQVVPHLPARLVEGEGHLGEILRRLDELQITEILVIGGNPKEPVGPYSSSFELLSAMAELGHGFEHVGIAGYPEGHPDIDDEVLYGALSDKQPLATHVVTQMCFDPDRVVAWISEVRRRGIHLPVLVGMPGVVEIKHLLWISRKIGVGDSTRFLRKHAGLTGIFFASLLKSGSYSPDTIVEELEPYLGDPDYDIAGFHLYTFNQVEATEKWRRSILGPEEAAT